MIKAYSSHHPSKVMLVVAVVVVGNSQADCSEDDNDNLK
jgi:hypothetical protein